MHNTLDVTLSNLFINFIIQFYLFQEEIAF